MYNYCPFYIVGYAPDALYPLHHVLDQETLLSEVSESQHEKSSFTLAK